METRWNTGAVDFYIRFVRYSYDLYVFYSNRLVVDIWMCTNTYERLLFNTYEYRTKRVWKSTVSKFWSKHVSRMTVLFKCVTTCSAIIFIYLYIRFYVLCVRSFVRSFIYDSCKFSFFVSFLVVFIQMTTIFSKNQWTMRKYWMSFSQIFLSPFSACFYIEYSIFGGHRWHGTNVFLCLYWLIPILFDSFHFVCCHCMNFIRF